ncbi:MAG: hypothetical protein CMI36_01000 [Owenweeksia sp.]|nr:hypothetical protein [Owenweeksia sp.]
MEPKRISSNLTIYFAWILPIAIIAFWTLVTIVISFSDFSVGPKIYLILATAACWAVYLWVKPWKLKRVTRTEEGLIFKDSKKTRLIRFDQIKNVKVVLPLKLSPVVNDFKENKETRKLSFISRLTSPTFGLPFEKNSTIEELNKIKTGANKV